MLASKSAASNTCEPGAQCACNTVSKIPIERYGIRIGELNKNYRVTHVDKRSSKKLCRNRIWVGDYFTVSTTEQLILSVVVTQYLSGVETEIAAVEPSDPWLENH